MPIGILLTPHAIVDTVCGDWAAVHWGGQNTGAAGRGWGRTE